MSILIDLAEPVAKTEPVDDTTRTEYIEALCNSTSDDIARERTWDDQ